MGILHIVERYSKILLTIKGETLVMKKCFVVVTILGLLLCGCSSETDDWKILNIEECGTIQIPNDWEYSFRDGIIYITSNEKPIMISYERTGKSETNYFFSNFKYVDISTSAVLSNGAIYGKAKYYYLDNEIERYYLNLGETKNGELVEFLVWDKDMNEQLLLKIAKTFTLE